MRIAVICQNASTGGWRVIKNLLIAMAKRAELYVVIDSEHFLDDYLYDVMAELKGNNIKLIDSKKYNKKIYINISFVNRWINSVLKRVYSRRQRIVKEMIEKNRFDAILYPWPYDLPPKEVSSPQFFISHDLTALNHYGCTTGSTLYHKKFYDMLKMYVKTAYPVCISRFGMNDLRMKYKNIKESACVYWSSFCSNKNLNQENSKKIISKFNINTDYIIYPTNLCPHKNVGAFIYAGKILKERGWNIKCILIGYETEQLCGKFSEQGVAADLHGEDDWDVKGFGLVSDIECESLIQNARCLVSTSCAEGACGPGADAWTLGTPTVLSDIEVFHEYAAFHGVHSEFANPRNAFEFADKIEKILSDREYYHAISDANRERMKAYTWDDVAEKYIQFFQRTIQDNKKGRFL